MKKLTPDTLLKELDNWRLLTAMIPNAFPESDNVSVEKLEKLRNSCSHEVYVHLSTIYKDDGLCDPDFFSSYRCVRCGSTAYDVPSKRFDRNMLIINMKGYGSGKHYSDEEKFAIAELRLRHLVREHPDFTLETVINLLNEEFAKK